MLRADFQSKGRSIPAEVSVDAYAQYKSAFYSLVRHGDIERLSADERKALSAGSDPDGGYLLPTPTVGRMVKKVYEQSTMRQLANVMTISTDALEGIVDNDEADAGWVSEMGARNDTDTPQLGKYRIEAHEMYAQPKVTQKVIDDAATDVEAWLAEKVGGKFARVEGAAFWTGDGVGKPRGLAAYTTAATADGARAWGTFEHVVTGSNGAFHTTKADPLQDLLGAFKDQYLQNAAFVMRREVRTLIRKMKEATSDRYLWEPSLQAGQPDRLLGYPVLMCDELWAFGLDCPTAGMAAEIELARERGIPVRNGYEAISEIGEPEKKDEEPKDAGSVVLHIPAFRALAICNEHLNHGPISIEVDGRVIIDLAKRLKENPGSRLEIGG